jgi:multidrug efflux pump subunit AcrB
VTLGGYRPRAVRVWVDAKRLEGQGLTVTDIVDALKREHVEIPAGRIETADREMNVRAEGEALTSTTFSRIVVSTRPARRSCCATSRSSRTASTTSAASPG